MPVQTDGCVLRQPKCEFLQKDAGQATKIILSYIWPARRTVSIADLLYRGIRRIIVFYVYKWKKKNHHVTHLVVQSRRSRVTNQPHRDPEPFRGWPELRALRKESIFSLSVCTTGLSASGGLKQGLPQYKLPYTNSHQNTLKFKKTNTHKQTSLTNCTHSQLHSVTDRLLSCNIIMCLCCQ